MHYKAHHIIRHIVNEWSTFQFVSYIRRTKTLDALSERKEEVVGQSDFLKCFLQSFYKKQVLGEGVVEDGVVCVG